MDERTRKQEQFPTPDEAANNNINGPTGEAIEPQADEASPETRVSELEAELADHKDRLLRALAETENVRRRAQREREDASKYAVAGFARDLLSAADNLRRALESLPETEAKDDRTRSLLAGVAATERELLGVFERHGIKRIHPMGERFDHNFHQAIFEAERPEEPSGSVIEVLQPGYVLHDRLLRPAMVGVAKGGTKPSDPA
ncbi:MAG: nucleotide exchange factor GrpE [Alphaproteobacteria bacterium]|nr:nucleotide exchange factor GrpE [Alphaproteobacteria bacterium]MBV9374221.1 nucleotide exchange factor GrpE [Alphaproteobacteria bacterium]